MNVDFDNNTIYYFPKTNGLYRAVNKTFLTPSGNYTGSERYYWNLEAPSDTCRDLDARITERDGDFIFIYPSQEAKNEFAQYIPSLKQTYSRLLAQSKTLKPILVKITDIQEINAFAKWSRFACSKFGVTEAAQLEFTLPYLRLVKNNSEPQIVDDAFAHEFGHLVQFNFFSKEKDLEFAEEWMSLARYIEGQPYAKDLFDVITDGNVFITPDQFGGHPWDDENELFATFYADFFNAHDQLYGRIMYHTNGEMREILKYIWQLFSERVGEYYPNDNTIFRPKGGRVTGKNYTIDQIRTGVWHY